MSNELNHFLILGNARSGTSLLCAILNSHSAIYCAYEEHFKRSEYPRWIIARQVQQAAKKTYGNKQPIEQLLNNGWSRQNIVSLIENWYIINMYRKASTYIKRMTDSHMMHEATATNLWQLNHDFYFTWLEKYPDKVMRVCFEDFVLRPFAEVRRVLDFLAIKRTEKKIAAIIKAGPRDIQRYTKRDRIERAMAFV